jgi:hypothetical protein
MARLSDIAVSPLLISRAQQVHCIYRYLDCLAVPMPLLASRPIFCLSFWRQIGWGAAVPAPDSIYPSLL